MTKEVDKSSPAFLQDKLWDEITKSIAERMPNQLFPLFKEAFGKEYPKGTTIRIIQNSEAFARRYQREASDNVYSI